MFLYYSYVPPRALHSFPTRRSSDLPDVVFSPMQTIGSAGRKFGLILTLHDLIYYQHRTPPKDRSEEHTSELQSRGHLVCRLLLEKKKTNTDTKQHDHAKN